MYSASGGQSGREVTRLARVRRVLTLVAAFVLFALASTRFLRAIASTINSDSLYLAGLYRDIFIDKIPIGTWQVQPAPSFFPDLPAFFLLRAVTGSAAAATCAYGACELLVEAALLACILRILGSRDRWSAYSASFLILAFMAYVVSCSEFLQILFYPSIHSGSLLIGLASGVLVIGQLRRGQVSLARASALAILTALTAGFDSLYLLIGAMPLLVATLFCAVVSRKNRVVALVNGAALGLGIVLSAYIRHVPAKLGIEVPPKAVDLVFSRDRLRDALAHWPPPGQPRVITLDVGLVVMSLIIATVILWRSVRSRTPAGEARRDEAVFLCASFLGSLSLTVSGVVFAGYYFEPGCARYLQPLFVFPYMVVGAWFALARTHVLRVWAAAYVLYVMQHWPAISHIATGPSGGDSCIHRTSLALTTCLVAIGGLMGMATIGAHERRRNCRGRHCAFCRSPTRSRHTIGSSTEPGSSAPPAGLPRFSFSRPGSTRARSRRSWASRRMWRIARAGVCGSTTGRRGISRVIESWGNPS